MNRHFKCSIFLFSILMGLVSFSQNDTTPKRKGNAFLRLNRKLVHWVIKEPKPFCDTNYVKTYSKVLTIGLPVSSKSFRIGFADKKTGSILNYYPAVTYSPGLFINTSLFGFFITPSFIGIHQNSTKRGTSDYNDYQFNIYAKRFFYDISLRLYSGFYLNNTKAYQQYESLENFYQRPDLVSLSGSFNIFYVFNNKKFSFRAPFSFTQAQIKSAGSFIIGTYLSDFAFTADSSVIGSQLTTSFESFPSLKSGNSFSTGLSFGYAYTYVLKKKFYISCSLIPGIGISKLNLERMDRSVYNAANDASFKFKFTFGAGYNTSKWFFGMMFLSDSYYNISEVSPLDVNYQLRRFRVFIGRRFNARKIEDKILRKFHLD